MPEIMTEESAVEFVIKSTGAESAKVLKKVTHDCWSVLASFPDGPDAFTFRKYLVDIGHEEQEPRIMGLPIFT
jgi:hypothetical protein